LGSGLRVERWQRWAWRFHFLLVLSKVPSGRSKVQTSGGRDGFHYVQWGFLF
jgi:hypothetical protein